MYRLYGFAYEKLHLEERVAELTRQLRLLLSQQHEQQYQQQQREQAEEATGKHKSTKGAKRPASTPGSGAPSDWSPMTPSSSGAAEGPAPPDQCAADDSHPDSAAAGAAMIKSREDKKAD